MYEIIRKKVLHFIEENGLFAPGDKVVVAVSGGADSVALLDMLVSHGELCLDLVVAHLNHQLRGPESDGDEEFVRQLAKGYGVPAEVRCVDVREIAGREGRSLEDAGRYARYRFLGDVADSHGASVVALAHHRDDQAETVLMRLLRGSGGSGLCAMNPKSAGRYVRPLLCVTRCEIEAYLRSRGISWRDDSSNASVEFLRNRIRHELIPMLSSYNPEISERLACSAEALAADEEVLNAVTDAAFARHAAIEEERVKLSLAGVRSEPRGIRARIYRQAILRAKGDLERISFTHLKAIDRLVLSERPNSSITLPERIVAARSYGVLSFEVIEGKRELSSGDTRIDGPGIFSLPGGGVISVDFCDPPEKPVPVSAATEYFDAEEVPFPWTIRTFRPGDRISPFGMAGQKKVKDLFVDGKIPLQERRRIPLIFCDGTLLWVAGVRRGSAAAIRSKTVKVYRVELLAKP